MKQFFLLASMFIALNINAQAPMSAVTQKLQNPNAQNVNNSNISAVSTIVWTDLDLSTGFNQNLYFATNAPGIQQITMTNSYGEYTVYGYAYKITLSEAVAVIGSSNSYLTDFTVCSDPAATNREFYGFGMVISLDAGVHYLIISENGNLQWSWNPPFTANIVMSLPPVTDISLDYQAETSINLSNSTLIAGTYHARFFKFILDEPASVTFDMSFNAGAMGADLSTFEIDLLKYDNNVTSSALPLPAGTYIIDVYPILWSESFWNTHSDAVLNLNIHRVEAEITALQVPSSNPFTFNPATVQHIFNTNAIIYSLHLDETKLLHFDDVNNNFAFIFYRQADYINVGSFYPNQEAIKELQAGDYFVLLSDYNNLYINQNPVSGLFTVSEPYTYADMDFQPEFTIGNTVSGSNLDLVTVITNIGYYGVHSEKAIDYSLQITAGHNYRFSVEVFADNTIGNIKLAYFTSPNTGDIDADNITTTFLYMDGKHGKKSTVLCADYTGIVNFFLFGMPTGEFIYNLTIEDISETSTDAEGTNPHYEVMTLPFVSYLHFDPSHNAALASNNYNKLYTLTLAERSAIMMTAGVNRPQHSSCTMYFFSDAERTHAVGSTWGYSADAADYIILNPGTYYVVLSDGGYYNSMSVYAQMLVSIEKVENFLDLHAMSVPELFNDPNITVVNYQNNMPYTNNAYWVFGSDKIVTDNEFYINKLLAKGYMITGMNANNVLNIFNLGTEAESQIWIFSKTGSTYNKIASMQYNWDYPEFNGLAYYRFTAPASGNYYVMVSTSNSYPSPYYNATPYPFYDLKLWASGSVPNSGSMTIPAEMLVKATSSNITEIQVEDSFSTKDIKLALAPLLITATTNAETTFPVDNNIMKWDINEEQAVATFQGIELPYVMTASYSPATVQLAITSANKDDIKDERIKVFVNNETVNVIGLKGNEKMYLVDIQGHTLCNFTTPNLNISNLPHGIYIISVVSNNTITALKFVK